MAITSVNKFKCAKSFIFFQSKLTVNKFRLTMKWMRLINIITIMWLRPCGPMRTVTYLLFSMALTKKQSTCLSSLTAYPFQGQPGAGQCSPCSVTTSQLLKTEGSCCYWDFPFEVLRIFIKARDRSSRVSTSQNLYLITDFSICIVLPVALLPVLRHRSLKQRAAALLLGTGWDSAVWRVKTFLKKWGSLQLCLQRQVLETQNSQL